MPLVIGGRYGLSSKDFDPAQARAVFDELKQPEPKNGFTVGINDDVGHLSLAVDPGYDIEPEGVVTALFYGLGSDGTVGANKNSVKIIAEDAGLFAQGYFEYDSHKSGAQTISHLRFGPQPIRMPYLVRQADFVACHQFHFLQKLDVLRHAAPGATFLLNSPYGADKVWDRLPRSVQQQLIDGRLRFFVIDASRAARELGLGRTPTPSCRPASLPSPACCRATRRSPASSTASKRPMAKRANRSSGRISPPWTVPWRACSKLTFRPARAAISSGRRSYRQRRPTSFAG